MTKIEELRDRASKLRIEAAKLEAQADKLEEPIVKLEKKVAELEKEVAELRSKSYIKIWPGYYQYPFWHTYNKITLTDNTQYQPLNGIPSVNQGYTICSNNAWSDQSLANRL